MRRLVGCLIAILVPVAAWAQPQPFAVSERPAAGVFIGPASNSEQYSGDSGRDIGFVFDAPVVFGRRVRADVSRVVWHFQNLYYPAGLPVSDTVTMKSIRLGLVGVRHAGPRVAGYAGGGYGVYHFDYAVAPLRKPWRGGLHGMAGMEILSAAHRLAFDGELRLHAINGARQRPLPASLLLQLEAAIGMKVRF
jgi:hypothetical protein